MANIHLNNIYIITLLIIISLAQSGDPTPQSKDFVSVEGQILSQEAKQQEDLDDKIPHFVIQEIKQAKINQEIYKHAESFIVSLNPAASFEFLYKIKSNPHPSLVLRIFTQETEDDIAIIKDHQIDNFLEVFSSTNLFGTYISVGKAFAHKFIQLGSHSGSQLFIRLDNKFQRQIIVEVSLSNVLQKLDQFDVIKNSQFSVTAKKIEAIQSEMKQVQAMNRKRYKFEWGFLEREQHYDEQMLKLTGVEAVIILATAIVQIYCIKSLIDKDQAIV